MIKDFFIQKLYKRYYDSFSCYRIRSLQNKNFSIISNNCWGGQVYRSYGLPYTSPTIGLFIMPKDYIKFISDLTYYLEKDLKFIYRNQSKYRIYLEEHVDHNCPIGILEDIEIIFLHYTSENDAYNSWNRRKKRVNFENVLFKFNDQNLCTREDIEAFDLLNLKHKVCFTVQSFPKLHSCVQIKSVQDKDFVPYYYEPIGKTSDFNVTEFINNMVRND